MSYGSNLILHPTHLVEIDESGFGLHDGEVGRCPPKVGLDELGVQFDSTGCSTSSALVHVGSRRPLTSICDTQTIFLELETDSSSVGPDDGVERVLV